MDHPPGPSHRDTPGPSQRGLGAVNLPKLPTKKKNLVAPCTEEMLPKNMKKKKTDDPLFTWPGHVGKEDFLHEYSDDIDHLPYSAASIDDTTDHCPLLNKKTDSEVLIGRKLKSLVKVDEEEETDSTDVPSVTVKDGSDVPASQRRDHAKPSDEAKLDVEHGDLMWSKSVQGRVRKGFETKEKKANIPPIIDRDKLGFHKKTISDHEGLTDSALMQDKSFVKRHIWTMLSPTDNRLSMKLFGSRKGIQKEKRRLKDAGSLIIHPCSKFRFYWDLIMLNLIVFNILALPVVITYFKQEDLSFSWILFNCIMDTLFMMDVVFNFRTGFMDNQSSERVILSPKRIAKHYMKTWFVVDFISCIPMDYVLLMFDTDNSRSSKIYEVSKALKFLRFAKLLSLVRLLRLSRLMRFVGQYEQIFNVASAVIRIFNLVMIMLLIGHWNGCLQFLVPVIQEFPPYSWVTLNRLQNVGVWEQYTWSLFKAMSHMLCIGYGRFPPQCTSDVWLTMISMISGATCFALFIGHATNLIQSMDSSARQYREKVKQVEEYMSYNKLPREMRLKVLDYYEYRYHGKMFDEVRIFDEISQTILEDIANYNCRELVAAVPFFTDADPAFVTRVVSLLSYELFQPGDYILREGTFGDRMFFIQSGIVDIITPEGYTQTTLSDGSYFGEICLLTKLRRTASVKACSYCCLYSLSVDKFFNILKEYPAMHKTMREVAKVRLAGLGKESEIGYLDSGMDAAEQLEQTQLMFNLPSDVIGSSSSSVGRYSRTRNVPSPLAVPRRYSRFDDPEAVAKESERLIHIINIQDQEGRSERERDHFFKPEPNRDGRGQHKDS